MARRSGCSLDASDEEILQVADQVANLEKLRQKTLVQLPNYRGMGGHGVENHGGHGDYTQVSIGLTDVNVNFRQRQ